MIKVVGPVSVCRHDKRSVRADLGLGLHLVFTRVHVAHIQLANRRLGCVLDHTALFIARERRRIVFPVNDHADVVQRAVRRFHGHRVGQGTACAQSLDSGISAIQSVDPVSVHVHGKRSVRAVIRPDLHLGFVRVHVAHVQLAGRRLGGSLVHAARVRARERRRVVGASDGDGDGLGRAVCGVDREAFRQRVAFAQELHARIVERERPVAVSVDGKRSVRFINGRGFEVGLAGIWIGRSQLARGRKRRVLNHRFRVVAGDHGWKGLLGTIPLADQFAKAVLLILPDGRKALGPPHLVGVECGKLDHLAHAQAGIDMLIYETGVSRAGLMDA